MIKKCIICKNLFKITGELNIEKRKCCSRECGNIHKSLKFIGKGNPFFGKKHSIITSKRMKKSRSKFFKNGGKSPSWKGGERVATDGYKLIHTPNHPFKDFNNYVREHRIVVEKQIGRYLLKKESVHHIDEIKINNIPENLIAFTSESAHQRFHFNPNNVKQEEIIFDGRKLPKICNH